MKTKGSPGRWFTTVTFIAEMDGQYFHIRKDGINSLKRDIMYMKCNNGATCPWKGTVQTKDRFLTQSDKEYFNTNNYESLPATKPIPHSDACLQKALSRPPTAEEAAYLPQNVKQTLPSATINQFAASDMRLLRVSCF